MKDSKDRQSKNEYENAMDRRLINTRSPSMEDVNNIRVNKEDKPILDLNRGNYAQISNEESPSVRTEKDEDPNKITDTIR